MRAGEDARAFRRGVLLGQLQGFLVLDEAEEIEGGDEDYACDRPATRGERGPACAHLRVDELEERWQYEDGNKDQEQDRLEDEDE